MTEKDKRDDEFNYIFEEIFKNEPTNSKVPNGSEPTKTRIDRLKESRASKKNPANPPKQVSDETHSRPNLTRITTQLHSLKNIVIRTGSKGAGFTRGLIKKVLVSAKIVSMQDSPSSGESMTKVGRKKSKRKYKFDFKRLIKVLLIFLLALAIILGATVFFIAGTAPPIQPGNIYSLLSENSVLYDDQGQIIESLQSGGLRTNVAYVDMPKNLINAFIAIEDKTFFKHNGFNIVRIFGAIFEGFSRGESISGTSTITQQLARNLYLAETKSTRSWTRKIREAYYTMQLERQLSKEQIIEAYLNTIYLGANANGVQAAAQSYFSKNVQDLTLAECALLASIPKSPSKYAPLKKYENSKVLPENGNIISKGDTYTIVYDPAFKDRQKLVLQFMLKQNFIDQAKYDSALSEDMKAAMKPRLDATNDLSSFFTDYIVSEIVTDLMSSQNITRDEAKYMIYNNGLKIYSTINIKVQKSIEKEFKDPRNFPKVVGLKKDSAGNILDSYGKVMLYSYSNYINGAGSFIFEPNDYKMLDNGDLLIFKDRRLNFYKTEVKGVVDYSVEFKNVYKVEDGTFYSYNGGIILIPAEYKSRDADGNIIVSKKLFKDKPGFLVSSADGRITVSSGYYLLKPKVIQPQAAAVITDYKTGQIKGLMGGRSLKGDMLYNRAINPQPPGSSIKPIGVYGPALNLGASQNGPWTAAYVVDDSPSYYNGKLWPQNWYNGWKGLVTIRHAVEQSMNVVAVKTFTQIGQAASIDFLKKVGVTTVVESGTINDQNAAALALGGMTNGISPLEMASAYGTFGNQGVYIKPVSYTKVTNKKGEIILETKPNKSKVMDPGAAFIMTDILRTTVSDGIAGAASIGTQPVAGKTGTTSNNYDAWFVGLTPYYSASVWIGNDIDIELSQGSKAASQLWSKIMKQAHTGLTAGSFKTADNVVSVAVDTISGELPSNLSAMDPRGTVRNEYFVQGTQPTSIDTMHVSAVTCNDSGYLVTPWCPTPVSRVFVKRPVPPDTRVGDFGYELPTYYCYLHNPDPVQYPISPSKTLDNTFIWVDPTLPPVINPVPATNSGINPPTGLVVDGPKKKK